LLNVFPHYIYTVIKNQPLKGGEQIMRKIIIILFIAALQPLFAQQETLIRSDKFTSGGFGGPVLKYTSFNNSGAMIIGGRGGWIINHSFVLGGGGYGLTTQVPVDVLDGDIIIKDSDNLYIMYGGFEMEYIFRPLKVIHISIYTLLGGGSIGYRSEFQDNHYDCGYNMGKSFFIAEPAVNLELNVTAFFHLAFGASYRYTNGANYKLINDDDIRGFSGIITVKFGRF
jgi:hypothetical protein